MEDRLIIKVDDKDREIFMSYGLLNVLTRVIEDPTQVPAVSIVPDLRETVLKELLAVRKKSGKITSPVKDIEDIDISIEDVEILLDWAMEHVMHFFVRRMEQVAKMTSRHETKIRALESSLDGSKPSPSATA